MGSASEGEGRVSINCIFKVEMIRINKRETIKGSNS